MFGKVYPRFQMFKKSYAGLYFNGNGATYITASNQPNSLDFSIEEIGFIDNADEESFVKARQGLMSRSLVATLAKSDYTLIKMEKPACKEKEMGHEILWALQDQLPFDAEDAVVRWFDSPPSSMQTNFIFAMAINNHYFNQRLTFLKNLTGKVVDITIPELAKSALLLKEASRDCSIVYLDILDNDHTIMVVKNGLLMASKRIPKNFSSEMMPSPEDITFLNNTIQQVLLPLNVGKQYKIILFSNDQVAESLSSQFHELLNIETTCFPKSVYIHHKIDDEILWHNGLIALGGIYSHVQNH
jgi:hypothetical protein